MTRTLLIIIIVLLGVILIGGGYYLGMRNSQPAVLTPTIIPPATLTPAPTNASVSPTGTTFISSGPNPASAFCIKQGGTLTIETRGDGGQYGLCNFDDGYACEEWAMMRGDCPVGGVRTTGFDTIEQKYCAWSGGSTLAVPNATCTFKDGSTCSDTAFYNGTCQTLPAGRQEGN